VSIKVLLRGGLGNQLFQYSAARSLSIFRDAPLIVDPLWCKRRVEIGHFPLKAKVIVYGEGQRRRDSISWRIRRKLADIGRPHFVYNDPFYIDRFWQNPGHVKITGYYQSYRYFADYYDQFADEIDLTSSVAETLTDAERGTLEGSIAVHVRRGDYLTTPGFPMADVDAYYTNGIAAARSMSKLDRLTVFSDDTEWCRGQPYFSGASFWPANLELPHRDLFAMSLCGAVVIANSTFSWWAGWFASQRGKPVVAPKVWIRGRPTESMPLAPPTWVVI
jgi:hypothetical protein